MSKFNNKIDDAMDSKRECNFCKYFSLPLATVAHIKVVLQRVSDKSDHPYIHIESLFFTVIYQDIDYFTLNYKNKLHLLLFMPTVIV
jgi:hypothetical protein